MKCLDTSSRSAMLKAMLLVWLAAFEWVGPVYAETAEGLKSGWTADHGHALEFATFKADDPYRGSGSDYPLEAMALGSADNSSRADLFTLTRLAVEELEFLAGIRILWDRAEKKFDRVALKLKLKGDISLNANDPPAAQRTNPSASLRGHPHKTRSKPSPTRLSLRSLLLPYKIRWHFGLDPNQQAFFGELKWGRFIALQSDVGSHQEIKMVFQYDF